MDPLKNLREAEEWFLENKGQVNLIKEDGTTISAGSYPDAVAFFGEEKKEAVEEKSDTSVEGGQLGAVSSATSGGEAGSETNVSTPVLSNYTVQPGQAFVYNDVQLEPGDTVDLDPTDQVVIDAVAAGAIALSE